MVLVVQLYVVVTDRRVRVCWDAVTVEVARPEMMVLGGRVVVVVVVETTMAGTVEVAA